MQNKSTVNVPSPQGTADRRGKRRRGRRGRFWRRSQSGTLPVLADPVRVETNKTLGSPTWSRKSRQRSSAYVREAGSACIAGPRRLLRFPGALKISRRTTRSSASSAEFWGDRGMRVTCGRGGPRPPSAHAESVSERGSAPSDSQAQASFSSRQTAIW